MNNKKKIFNLLFYIIGIVVLTELDQITKALAEAKLLGKPDFKIIGDAFVFSYLRNSGAAWGMLSGKINLFLVFTVIVMLIVTYVIINLPATRKYMPLLITCTLLVSGAVGNFIDRVRFGYVRDFIYFKLINFPVFNVADCYVTVSVALLIILILFVYKEGYRRRVIIMSDSVQNLIAEPEDKGTRIDKYLSQELEDVSRSRIQKLLDDGDITVDDKCVKSNYKLNGTEHITITIPELIVPQILPENIPLNIIYEDDDVILIDKPKGMVVHPAAGHYTGTVVNALMYHCRDNLSGINGVMRPGIVHRIDMNTTGVIVACKNDKAHNDIAAQLAVHSITRKYYCIVHNRFKEEEGTVNAPIGRNPKDRKMMAIDRKNGKRAVTHYRVLENFDKYSFIECQLETGRTHQIRVHMASIGHPILGDDVYSHAKSGYKLQGQTLHAGVLGFIHPSTGEYMEFKAPLPGYFEKLLKDLRNGGSN